MIEPRHAESLAQLDVIRARVMGLCRRQRRLSGSEWADQHFYLSPESSADLGRWRTRPYQREPLDAMTDPHIEHVTFMKSARVGYTKMLGAAIGSFIHQDPCPISIVQPTLEDAQGYSKEEIAPMLRDSPALAVLVPESKTRDSNNTILHKQFPGGIISVIGANSGRGFRRVTRRVMAFDETDAYPLSAGSEGDPIRLGIRRTETFWNRKIIDGSTPLLEGSSRIDHLYRAGDQRRYYVPCPHCSEMAYLVFTEKSVDAKGDPAGHFMSWPKGRPDEAHFVCRGCGSAIEHKHKFEMVHAGQWRPHAPFLGHASFHLWTAYSFSPNATWGQIAAEFLEANAAGPEDLKTFVNTVLGETWKPKGDAPPWEILYQRRAMYEIGTCPPGVLFLTVGVDVQKDRLIYEVVGWGRGKKSWSIDVGTLQGDTADMTAVGPWPRLDALLARGFPHAGGLELHIALMAVDSGFNTQTVYNWARRHPMSRVIAVKGVDTASVLIGSPSMVDISTNGKKLKRGYKVWPVAGNIAKSELYGWLQLFAPTDEARSKGALDAPGTCTFPQYGEDFFRELTAEHLVAHKVRGGFVRFVWELIPGRQNHALDCRVYARAAAALVGLDRFRESDWATLEQRLGVKPPEPPAPAAVPIAAAPVAVPRTVAAPVMRRDPWLGGRPRGGWLKGR